MIDFFPLAKKCVNFCMIDCVSQILKSVSFYSAHLARLQSKFHPQASFILVSVVCL